MQAKELIYGRRFKLGPDQDLFKYKLPIAINRFLSKLQRSSVRRFRQPVKGSEDLFVSVILLI